MHKMICKQESSNRRTAATRTLSHSSCSHAFSEYSEILESIAKPGMDLPRNRERLPLLQRSDLSRLVCMHFIDIANVLAEFYAEKCYFKIDGEAIDAL